MTPCLLKEDQAKSKNIPWRRKILVLRDRPFLESHENTLLRAIRTIMCGLWPWKGFVVEEN